MSSCIFLSVFLYVDAGRALKSGVELGLGLYYRLRISFEGEGDGCGSGALLLALQESRQPDA